MVEPGLLEDCQDSRKGVSTRRIRGRSDCLTCYNKRLINGWTVMEYGAYIFRVSWRSQNDLYNIEMPFQEKYPANTLIYAHIIQRKITQKIPISNITHVQSAKYLWERRFRSSLREAIVARGGIRVTLAPGRAGLKCLRTEVAKCRV